MKTILKILLILPFSALLLSACTSSQVSTTTPNKNYTLSDVSKHAIETDCWMAINNKVYDVTKFVPNHPGGKMILKGCGTDATVLFEQRPDTDKGPHPDSAKEALKNFYIGDLNQ